MMFAAQVFVVTHTLFTTYKQFNQFIIEKLSFKKSFFCFFLLLGPNKTWGQNRHGLLFGWKVDFAPSSLHICENLLDWNKKGCDESVADIHGVMCLLLRVFVVPHSVGRVICMWVSPRGGPQLFRSTTTWLTLQEQTGDTFYLNDPRSPGERRLDGTFYVSELERVSWILQCAWLCSLSPLKKLRHILLPFCVFLHVNRSVLIEVEP